MGHRLDRVEEEVEERAAERFGVEECSHGRQMLFEADRGGEFRLEKEEQRADEGGHIDVLRMERHGARILEHLMDEPLERFRPLDEVRRQFLEMRLSREIALQQGRKSLDPAEWIADLVCNRGGVLPQFFEAVALVQLPLESEPLGPVAHEDEESALVA